MMATTVRPVPSLEVTATVSDAMDLRSDGGLDFADGDGDADIELRSAAGSHRQDDDLSLRDAGSDGGLDMQTVTADQDDYMVDHEDIIDEDDLDLFPAESGGPSTEVSGAAPVQTTEVPDEDLLDYSDDEEMPQGNGSVDTAAVEQAFAQDVVSAYDEPSQPAAAQGTLEEYGALDQGASSRGGNAKLSSREAAIANQRLLSQDASVDNNAQSRVDPGEDDHAAEAEKVKEEEVHEQQEDELYVDGDTASQDGHSDFDDTLTKEQDQAEAYDEGSYNVVTEHDRQVQQPLSRTQILAHPVTVNYEGSELWLFKQHDHERSGDYMLEDQSTASTQISDLFNACRSALGTNITDDIEIGFRFDHFHNMELYQDNTPCALLTLEELIGLYLQLHAHDGNSEPESFYVTLLFRPRVLAMYNELKRAVMEGISYTSLNRAVAAGHTAFNAQLAHHSPENRVSWDEEEQEHESHGNEEEAAADDQPGANGDEYTSHEKQEGIENENNHESIQGDSTEEEHHEGNVGHSDVQPEEEYFDKEHSVPRSDPNDRSLDGTQDQGSPPDSQQGESFPKLSGSQSRTDTAPATESNDQEEEDLLDYSDDEDPTEFNETAHLPGDQPSSSSSTVQGDDAASVRDPLQSQIDQKDSPDGVQNEDDETSQALDAGTDVHHREVSPNQDSFDSNAYGDVYEYGHEQYAEELESYSATGASQGEDENTNYYDGFGVQDVDQHTDSAPAVEVGEVEDRTEAGVDVFEDEYTENDFLDFDAVEGFAQDQTEGGDEIDYDGEGGAAGETPVDVSVGADPVPDSSAVLSDLSPQGQKRTIDDVSNDGGDATELTDAKRPRV